MKLSLNLNAASYQLMLQDVTSVSYTHLDVYKRQLKGLTPFAFEQYIKELNDENKPNLPIWTCDYSKNINPNQTILQF